MIFQTAMSGSLSEAVFRVARSGITKTLTNTNVSNPTYGSPVVLATATASADGTYVVNALTNTSVVNNLFVGIVYDYPERHSSTTLRWGGEQTGLIQCYGFADYARVHQSDTAVTGGGLYLIPGINELFTVAGSIPTGIQTATSTAGHATDVTPALCGLCVLMEDIASSSATGVDNNSVFLRCM